ncbi:hypothetical protein PENTCL1PPCAC_14179, partial [Pristionchus entomophagus]
MSLFPFYNDIYAIYILQSDGTDDDLVLNHVQQSITASHRGQGVDVSVRGEPADGLILSELLHIRAVPVAECTEIGEVGDGLSTDSGRIDVPVPKHHIASEVSGLVRNLLPVVVVSVHSGTDSAGSDSLNSQVDEVNVRGLLLVPVDGRSDLDPDGSDSDSSLDEGIDQLVHLGVGLLAGRRVGRHEHLDTETGIESHVDVGHGIGVDGALSVGFVAADEDGGVVVLSQALEVGCRPELVDVHAVRVLLRRGAVEKGRGEQQRE